MYNLFAQANKKRAKRRGFTLIELVIVIVILGILAGVAALSFQNVTQSSRNGVAKANLRALKSAAQVYQADKAGKLPSKLGDLYSYLDPDLQKACGIADKNATADSNADDYTYALKATAATTSTEAFIEITVVSKDQTLNGDKTKDEGTYYKITGLK